MRVIILAAGASRRFAQEGITVPKPFVKIEWRGNIQTMLEHNLATIPYEFRDISVAVPPKWDKTATQLLHGRNITVHEIYSRGPADTALQLIRRGSFSPTLILDVDVLNFTNDLVRLTKAMNCAVLVSWSANPAFSYVEQTGQFVHIAEKKRISEFAVRGAYFIPASYMAQFAQHTERIMSEKTEPFISHVFNSMGDSKYALKTSYTPIEWGTPRDIRISGAHITMGKDDVRNRSA